MWMDLILSVKGLKSKNWGLPEKKKFCLKTAGSNQLYSNKFFFFLSCKINSWLSFQLAQQTVDFPAFTTAQFICSVVSDSLRHHGLQWTSWTTILLANLFICTYIFYTHTHTHIHTHTHFGPHCEAYRTLILQPGIKSGPLALGAQSCSLSQ